MEVFYMDISKQKKWEKINFLMWLTCRVLYWKTFENCGGQEKKLWGKLAVYKKMTNNMNTHTQIPQTQTHTPIHIRKDKSQGRKQTVLHRAKLEILA